MIVVDASIILEILLNSHVAREIAQRFSGNSLHAPHVLDLEVTQALRRLVRTGQLGDMRSEQALADLMGLKVTRYPHTPFLSRIWGLRHNLTAYDASYVALAESLDAPLLTRDAFLASAPGHDAHVELM